MNRLAPSLLPSILWLVAVLAGPLATGGEAEPPQKEIRPTPVEVRVIAKGAKFVGTSMGGAEVTIRDAATGELLAQGVTSGSTGDTAKIMVEPKRHHAPVSSEGAALFRTTLQLEEPRQIAVTARGPLAQPQAINTVSATQWVVPGKPITGGDALSLELPGFVVDVLAPPAHRKLSGSAGDVEVRANVVLMCGCPLSPETPWDPAEFEIAAIVKRDGRTVAHVPLEYAGETSQFVASLEAAEPGAYEVTVYAYDPGNGNTGLDKTSFLVEP